MFQFGADTWLPDGSKFIATSPGGSFQVIDAATGTILWTLSVNNNGITRRAWHPRGNLIAYISVASMVNVVRESDLQPHWHAVLLPDGKSATFSGAGELLNSKPEELDPYLIYYVDRGQGQIETLTPAEFRKLLPSSP